MIPQVNCRPCVETRITQRFGVNASNYPRWGRAGHEGIDVFVGERGGFYAVAAGIVAHAGSNRWDYNNRKGLSAYGIHVVVDHGDFFTVYAHASPWDYKKMGQYVEAGELLAYSGNTGRSFGHHLHFSLLLKERTGEHPSTRFGWYIDPSFVMLGDSPI